MATPLSKPVTRELDFNGAPYRVVLSPDGLRITRKHGRQGVTFSWDQLLAPDTKDDPKPSTVAPLAAAKLGMPDVVAADVLLLARRASDTIGDIVALVNRASDLPASLAMHREPPPPTDEQRSDWYLEPLLTVRQVAELLSVSTGRVRGLSLKPVNVDGQIRYQPAEVRRFLATRAESSRPLYGRR